MIYTAKNMKELTMNHSVSNKCECFNCMANNDPKRAMDIVGEAIIKLENIVFDSIQNGDPVHPNFLMEIQSALNYMFYEKGRYDEETESNQRTIKTNIKVPKKGNKKSNSIRKNH